MWYKSGKLQRGIIWYSFLVILKFETSAACKWALHPGTLSTSKSILQERNCLDKRWGNVTFSWFPVDLQSKWQLILQGITFVECSKKCLVQWKQILKPHHVPSRNLSHSQITSRYSHSKVILCVVPPSLAPSPSGVPLEAIYLLLARQPLGVSIWTPCSHCSRSTTPGGCVKSHRSQEIHLGDW